MASRRKQAALNALGVAANVAPRKRSTVVQRPAVTYRPNWRDAYEKERTKIWTNTRTPKASERAGVKVLDLKIREFVPTDLAKFPNIEKLLLRVHDDSQLAAWLAQAALLPKLLWLSLPYSIETLPPEIGQLKLKKLEIHGEWLWKRGLRVVPDEMCTLGKLEELEIDGCMIETLPKAFGNLKKLKALSLGACKYLAKLPREFGTLPALHYLDLQTPNSLDPDETFTVLAKLPKLASLRFRGEFTELPKSIAKLASLDWLVVGGHLTQLPAAIGKMTALRSLSVEFNELTSLPPQLADLPNLRSLGLYANDDLDLDEAVDLAVRCKQLASLHLPARGLSDAAVGKLQAAGFAQAGHMYGDSWIRLAKWSKKRVVDKLPL